MVVKTVYNQWFVSITAIYVLAWLYVCTNPTLFNSSFLSVSEDGLRRSDHSLRTRRKPRFPRLDSTKIRTLSWANGAIENDGRPIQTFQPAISKRSIKRCSRVSWRQGRVQFCNSWPKDDNSPLQPIASCSTTAAQLKSKRLKFRWHNTSNRLAKLRPRTIHAMGPQISRYLVITG